MDRTGMDRTVTMKKLIELDAALDALREVIVPEKDIGFGDELTDGYNDGLDMAITVLSSQPAVDAVPVVRCRDCEHKDRESGFCHGRGWPMQLVPDDGFCDKGKER